MMSSAWRPHSATEQLARPAEILWRQAGGRRLTRPAMHRAVLLLLAMTSVAGASPEPYATIELADPTHLRATLVNVPDARPAEITLVADSGERVTATSVTPYARTSQAIAIALVYSGDEIFIGNEEHEPAGTSRFHGTLNALKAALGQPAFTGAFPTGSQLVAITYDAGTRKRYPLGRLEQFRAAVLGTERDYRGRFGRELADGLERALDELDRATTPRRALIVISDGTDANPETARERFALLRKRALGSGVELYGVIYKTPVSDTSSVLTTMIPAARTIRSTSSMADAIAHIASQIGRRYEVMFPTRGLPRDGQVHALTITAGDVVLDPVLLVLPRVASTGCSVWMSCGLGVLVAVLLALGLLKSRSVRALIGS